VRTIEGFDDDELMNRLRAAFSREHALQCGFCTPGMLLTARDICQRLPGADEQRVRVELSGNLCRCTGYVGIVNAVRSVVGEAAPVAVAAKPAAPLQAFEASLQQPEKASASPKPVKGGTKIENSIDIAHPPAAVWRILSDLPLATSCLPGAELAEHDEKSAKGRIRIKFGPMAATFAGAAAIERDDANLSAVIRGAGVDNLSNSRARGDIAYKLVPGADGRATRVDITLDYSLTGPLAQFSRSGLVQDFAGRLMAEFGRNVGARIDSPQGAHRPAAELKAGSMLISVIWQRIRNLFTTRRG
jgi:carbon-monoxide dehydrogenase small subunit